MKRAKKVKRAAVKPALPFGLTIRDAATLKVIEDRLQRCCDLMSCLEYCQDAELNLGSLAIAARDLIDTVIKDLTLFRLRIEKPPG